MLPTVVLIAQLAAAPGAATTQSPRDAAIAEIRRDLDEGRAGAARSLASELTREHEADAEAWLLLGLAQNQNGESVDAELSFTRAIERGARGHDRVLAHLGRARSQIDRNHVRDAEADEEAAFQLEPHDPLVLQARTVVCTEIGDFDAALAAAEELATRDPRDAPVQVYLAALRTRRGDLDGGAAAAARARALGVDSPSLRDIDDLVRARRHRRIAWTLILLVPTLLSLALWLVSRAGKKLAREQLTMLDANETSLLVGDQTPAEQATTRAYTRVIGFATVLFYVSLPALVVLGPIAGIIGAWAIVAALPHFYVVLAGAVLVLVSGLVSAIAMVRGLVMRTPEEGGRELDEREAPQLFARLREIATMMHAPAVHAVYLTTEPNADVSERGGLLAVLLGRGERRLRIGLPLVHGMSVDEFESILAHEHGHIMRGELRYGAIVWRVMASLDRICDERRAGLGGLNPAHWYLMWFRSVYRSITIAHRRRHELIADRIAALHYGGETFARALVRCDRNALLEKRVVDDVLVPAFTSGRRFGDVMAVLAAAERVENAALRDEQVAAMNDRPLRAHDTHPSTSERIRRVRSIVGSAEPNAAPATSMFADVAALAKPITARLNDRLGDALARGHAVTSTRKAMTLDEETRFVEALVHYADAREEARRETDGAEARLVVAVESLEKLTGPSDVLLVGPLAEMSKGQPEDEAAATLRRALAILQSEPEQSPRRIAGLQQMLAEVSGSSGHGKSEAA